MTISRYIVVVAKESAWCHDLPVVLGYTKDHVGFPTLPKLGEVIERQPAHYVDIYVHMLEPRGIALEVDQVEGLGHTPAPTAYVLRTSDGRSIDVPEDASFALGYVAAGSLTLEAGSDDNGNGVLDESGEYYGTITLQIDFDGPQSGTELPVEKQPYSFLSSRTRLGR